MKNYEMAKTYFNKALKMAPQDDFIKKNIERLESIYKK